MGFCICLTHWCRVTHICVRYVTIVRLDNGLWPCRRQAIILTNAGILLIGPLGTKFNEILIGIQTFLLRKMQYKMSSAKWHPFCLGVNVLTLENAETLIRIIANSMRSGGCIQMPGSYHSALVCFTLHRYTGCKIWYPGYKPWKCQHGSYRWFRYICGAS